MAKLGMRGCKDSASLAFCFLAACGLLWPATGMAQSLDRSFEVQNFMPAIGPNQYLTVQGAEMPGHLGYGVSAFHTYQYHPLSIYTVDGSNLSGQNVVIDYQNTFYLSGFFAIRTKGLAGGYLFKEIQFGLLMPFTQQSGQLDVSGYALPGSTPSEVRGFALGDLRIEVKTSLWRFLEGKLRLALSATVSLPWTGDIPNQRAENNFAGEKNVTVWPKVIAEFKWRQLLAAVNVGFLGRTQESEFFSTTMGQQFTYGAAGYYGFYSIKGMRFGALLELIGRNGLSTDLDQNPLEVDGGFRIGFDWGLSITLGAGAGVIKAIGSPVVRAFLGVQYSPNRADSDDDGVPDYRDKCPNEKEDKDGFQDSDGCPDHDNDRDGIPDARDKCPNEMEDLDGFQDDDGCPDPDNDGDGVCDDHPEIQRNLHRYKKICTGKDGCPMHPGPKSSQGCPPSMLDTDGDKIPDAQDKCPNEPEDFDGFKDDDGCPDPDNDGDGVCDPNESIQENLSKYAKICKGKDQCPSDPEDRDGFEDDDGCPDPDNDKDHICDDNPVIQRKLSKYASQCVGADKCPNKPETINGYKDDDGCPDSGQPDITLSGDKLLLRRPVRFKSKSTRFQSPSQAVLRQLAWILRWRPDAYGKLVVVGFAEPAMKQSLAMKVTEAWAKTVKAYLVKHGVPEDKILARGLGNVKPVYTGSSRSTSKKLNRRVEFYLVK